MRAAIDALQHEHPGLRAVATTNMSGQDFATGLVFQLAQFIRSRRAAQRLSARTRQFISWSLFVVARVAHRLPLRVHFFFPSIRPGGTPKIHSARPRNGPSQIL